MNKHRNELGTLRVEAQVRRKPEFMKDDKKALLNVDTMMNGGEGLN